MRKPGPVRLRTALLITIIPLLVLITAGAVFAWYHWALRPLDAENQNRVRVTVSAGALAPQIGRQLKDDGLIRSASAFELYARLSGKQDSLQADTYAFAPNQSVADIVGHLESGTTDEFAVTILPGQTLKQIKTTLLGHGYTAAEIDAAMTASYPNALLASRGSQASLEGFLCPDTYSVLSDEPLQVTFGKIFDHFEDVIAENDLEQGFAARGLSLYQGITLASIVQKEVSTRGEDQRRVASVFYNRLAGDIQLGSDVTFIYGADLLGAEATPALDSPYNTRLEANKGLTPTPIASPDLSALSSVADPDQTDYLFFLAGDDGIIYYARSDAEHTQNIKDYCKINCQ